VAALVAAMIGLGFSLRHPGEVLRWTDGIRDQLTSQVHLKIEPITAGWTPEADG